MAQHYKVYNSDVVAVSQTLSSGKKIYIPSMEFAVYETKIVSELFSIYPALEVTEATKDELKEFEKAEKEREKLQVKIEKDLKAKAEAKAKEEAKASKIKQAERQKELEAEAEAQEKAAKEAHEKELEAIAEVASHTPTTAIPPEPVEETKKKSSKKVKVSTKGKKKK